MTINKQKSINYVKGKNAEDKIASIYKEKGFTILKKRYKNSFGEIDIIVHNDEQLAFIEVKHRKKHQNLEDAILSQQKTRITKAATMFLQETSPKFDNYVIHFDVAFYIEGFDPIIIENAWRVDELIDFSD